MLQPKPLNRFKQNLVITDLDKWRNAKKLLDMIGSRKMLFDIPDLNISLVLVLLVH